MTGREAGSVLLIAIGCHFAVYGIQGLILNPYPVANVIRYSSIQFTCIPEENWKSLSYENHIANIGLFLAEDRNCTNKATSSMLYTFGCNYSTREYFLTINNVSQTLNNKQIECISVGTQIEKNETILNVQYSPIENPVIKQTPPNAVVAGNNITLTCEVRGGNPLPVLSWICPGTFSNKTSENTASYKVEFTVDKDDNNRICTCSAKHPDPSYRPVVQHTVKVYYPPMSSPVLYRNESDPILTGKTINLTCEITGGNPLPILTWYCNEKKVEPVHLTINHTSISTLILKINKTFHGKSCVCIAAQPAVGYREVKSTDFTVFYASEGRPVIEQVPSGPINEGRGVSLKCKLAGGNPLPILTWNCTGDVMNETSKNESVSTLTFNVTAMDNTKLCNCVAKHSVISSFEKIGTHSLVVYYSPTDLPVVRKNPNGTVDNGTSVVLQCTAAGGNPLAILSWNCSGRKYNGHNRTSGNMANYTLDITVSPEDNGRLCVCSASHPIETYRANISLQLLVYYAPQNATITAIQQPWLAGKMYNISCTYIPGNPKTYTYWKLDEKILQDENGHTIELNAAKEMNGKSLTCEVFNNYTTRHNITVAAKNTRLNIEYPPELNVTTEHILQTEGDNITIVCIACGNPVPNITWIFNETIQSETNESKGELKLIYVNRSQRGEYICQATSMSAAHGKLQSRRSSIINVQYAPDIEVLSSDSSPTENDTITLSCVAEGNPPIYTYQGWRHTYNGNLIRDSDSLSENTEGNKLILKSVKYHDTGEYSCSAENGINNIYGLTQNGSREIEIKVIPLLLSHLPSGNTFAVKKNGNLSIEMDFVALPNVSSIEWYNVSANSTLKKNNEIKTDFAIAVVNTMFYDTNVTVTKNSFRATLDVINFQDYMEGWYSLLVTNNVRTANFSFRAVMSDKPDPPKNIKVNETTDTSIRLMWTRGDDGGHHQTFHFLYHERQQDAKLNKKTKKDTYDEQQLLSISGLKSGTFYQFIIFASNTIGNSSVLLYNASTSSRRALKPPKSQIGVIIGVIFAAVVLGLIVIIVFKVKRRYFPGGKGKEETGRMQLDDGAENDYGEEGLKDNVLYGLITEASNQTANSDQYAVVKKQNCKFDLQDDFKIQETTFYSEVKNIDKKGDKGGEKYINGKKTSNEYEKGKRKQEDVYENMENHKMDNFLRESHRNKDGLQYADLMFNSSPNGPRFIIHGLEDRTVYAEVDTTRQIDPLPDSDEEDTNNTE